MAETGLTPHRNRVVTCESFLKTLKREEIHASTYRDFEDLRGRVEEFIERFKEGFTLGFLERSDCTRSVHEWNVFSSLGLAFERKQSPRFVGNVSS